MLGECDHGGIGAAQLDGIAAAGDRKLAAGAGFPAHSHRELGGVGLGGGDGDIGDEGAQQPFAVFVAGGFGCPQHWQVGHRRGQLLGVGQLWLDLGLRGQGCVGFGQFSQRGLPSGFQAAGDETVFRFAGQECPLGPSGRVLGAFDGQFSGPHRSAASCGDLFGRGQRQGQLFRFNCGQQRLSDLGVDGVGAH